MNFMISEIKNVAIVKKQKKKIKNTTISIQYRVIKSLFSSTGRETILCSTTQALRTNNNNY